MMKEMWRDKKIPIQGWSNNTKTIWTKEIAARKKLTCSRTYSFAANH